MYLFRAMRYCVRLLSYFERLKNACVFQSIWPCISIETNRTWMNGIKKTVDSVWVGSTCLRTTAIRSVELLAEMWLSSIALQSQNRAWHS